MSVFITKHSTNILISFVLCLLYFMSVFETTAYMATCDGMKFYLKVWAGLTSRQQDNLLDFIKDPTLISLRDQKALPKVAFSILEVSKIIIRTLCSIYINTTGVISGAGTAYPTGASGFTPGVFVGFMVLDL